MESRTQEREREHDPNATSWVNLCNRSQTISIASTTDTTATLTNDANTIQLPVVLGSVTIEMFVKSSPFISGYNTRPRFWASRLGFSRGDSNQFTITTLDGNYNNTSNSNFIGHCYSAMQSGTAFPTIYKDGVSLSVNKNWSGTRTNTDTIVIDAGATTTELYFIRIYNRVLSAEEVAANFAIDKARFKIS